jgi:Zn-finger nucleic acid-binding protein
MAEARSLHCPNCGAAVESAAQRCPYCRARLAAISCPSCFGLMFDGAAFCEHCGQRRERTASGSGAGAATQCPACRGDLHRVSLGRTTLLECAGCDGIWIESEEFERLCADRESQAAVLPRLARRHVPLEATVKYRPCPSCGKMMNRVNFGRLSGAIVDVCKGHGTFLDAGELHQIVTFIHGGGLDRVRTLEKEELKAEARKVQQAQDKLARERTRHSGSRAQIGSGSDISGLIDLIDLMRGV